jgi:hypothetical protein
MRTALLLAALVAVPALVRAETFVGTAAVVKDTNWGQGCGLGPTKDFLDVALARGCVPIDPGISLVRLAHVYSLDTLQPQPDFQVLVPAELAKDVPFTIVLRREGAQADIAADTGAPWCATQFWLAPRQCGSNWLARLTPQCLKLLQGAYANEP